MWLKRMEVILARIANALEASAPEPMLQEMLDTQRQQVAQNKAANEMTERHQAECAQAHTEYFQHLEILARRIKALEDKEEPWQA